MRVSSHGRLVALLGAMVLAGGACIISPQPEPPRIDAEQIRAELVSVDPDSDEVDGVMLVGSAGAVSPGGATLSIVNLDREEATASLVAETDGSFVATLAGGPGDWLRLVASTETESSEPVYIVVPGDDGPVEVAPRPLEACLVLTPGTTIDFGQVSTSEPAVSALVVRNRCGELVRIRDVAFAQGGASLAACTGARDRCEADGEAACDAASLGCTEECEAVRAECGPEAPECEAALETCLLGCDEERAACVAGVAEPCDAALASCREGASASDLGLSFETTLPIRVQPDQAETITVRFAPASPGVVEAILMLDVAVPETGRLPITLTGEGVSP